MFTIYIPKDKYLNIIYITIFLCPCGDKEKWLKRKRLRFLSLAAPLFSTRRFAPRSKSLRCFTPFQGNPLPRKRFFLTSILIYIIKQKKSAVGFGKSLVNQIFDSFAKREVEGGYGPKYVGFSAKGREWVLVAVVLAGCFDGTGVQGMCPCPVSFLPLFFAGSKKSG